MSDIKILVIGELNPDGSLLPVTLQLTSKSYELLQKYGNPNVQVLITGGRGFYDKIAEQLSQAGADEVIIVNDDVLKEYNSARYNRVITEIWKNERADIIFFGATHQGRELAPLVATSLETGLTADCTGLDIIDGKLSATRPTFGGKLNAAICCKTLPQIATVRQNVFKIMNLENRNTPNVRFEWIDTNETEIKTEILEVIKDNSQDSLEKAEIIVSGGLGIKSKEGFCLLEELAACIGGTVGASRAAVDAGLVPQSYQIGQTGKTVSAKLYIACGISGAAQHIAGINSCDKIIAINTDKNAPIFKYADTGIVGDVFEIIPKLISELIKLK